MLNRYFTAVAEPVLNNNGFIDKYIGDGILAVFGTRDESPGTACRNAVRAALGMLEGIRRIGPAFEREFKMPLRIGIGIHFGTVIFGRVGHPGKRQITVIGDTVNTANRVESMTKPLGVPILLSDSVVAQIPGALQLGPPTEAPLKGKVTDTLLYPCQGFVEPDTILLVQSSFAHVAQREEEFGVRFYANLFEAHPEFRTLFPNDMAAQIKMLMFILRSAVRGFIPILDHQRQTKGYFTRADFIFDAAANIFVCPAGKQLTNNGLVRQDGTMPYRASTKDCRECALKARRTKGAKRIVTRNLHEAEREHVRRLRETPAFKRSTRLRKKVEMRFAHLKRNLDFRRLRLRGLTGAKDEFLLAAAAQNLQKLARFLGQGPPGVDPYAAGA